MEGHDLLFKVRTTPDDDMNTTELTATEFRNETLMESTHFVYGCLYTAISSFGLVSNVLLLAMMLTKELRSTAHGILFGFVSCVNVILSISRGVYGLFLVSGRSEYLVSCVASGVNRGLRSSMSYLICLVSLERTLALYFPLKRHGFFSVNKSRTAGLVVIVICMLLEISSNLKISLSSSSFVDVPVGLFFCPDDSRMNTFHVCFSYTVPIINLLVNGILLSLKLAKRQQRVKMNIPLGSNHSKIILERIQGHNQLTITTLCLFIHFILTSLPPVVVHLLNLSHVAMSTTGVQAAEVLTNFGDATILTTLLSNKYFRRTFYQVLCVHDVSFEASFNRNRTQARRRAQDHLECGLPDNRETCRRVVGLRLSSEISSSLQAPEETVIEKDIEVSVIGGTKEISSPTKVILTETALQLSNLGATYLN